MNTIKMFKYSFCYTIKSCIIFIAIIAAIVHLGAIISLFSDSSGGIGGMELSTYVYTAALGIVMFKENFNMSVQSGISRKTFFTGSVINNAILALITGTADTLLAILGNVYEKHIDNFTYDSMYEQTFLFNANEKIFLQSGDIFKAFLMNFTIDLAFIFIGFFVGAALYRLAKALKIIIPIAVYLLFQVVSIIDVMFFDSFLMLKLSKFIIWIMESSWHMSIFFPIIALLFAAGTFLFTRRMGINERT